jgi:hypothetical protein
VAVENVKQLQGYRFWMGSHCTMFWSVEQGNPGGLTCFGRFICGRNDTIARPLPTAGLGHIRRHSFDVHAIQGHFSEPTN